MTAPPSLRLPHLTRNQAQARNLLAQRAQHCPVTLVDQEWLLSLEPLLQPGGPAANPDDWLVHAQWAGAPFEIRLPASACQTWIRARFPDLDLPSLPDSVVTTLLEAALDQLLVSLRALQRGSAQIDAVAQSPAAPRNLPQAFALSLSQGDQTLHGRLLTDSLGLMLMAGLVSRGAKAPNALDHDALPVLLRAELGATVLPALAVEQLARGDTIMVEQAWISQAGELWLGQGSWGIRARAEDTRLTVTQTFASTGPAMPPHSDAPAEADHPVALDSVPIRLSFDLGERSMPLGELKNLQVGQSLDLVRPLSNAVSIRVNGTLIGTGELIDVDGRLGVYITTLAEKLSKPA